MVTNFLSCIPSETTQAILQFNGVTSYFEVRKPTWEEYEDQNILKIELITEALLWDPSSTEYSDQEQSTFDYSGRFVSPNTPARGQLFIKSVTLYAYEPADVMDDVNDAIVLDSYVTTSSLQVAKVHAKKVPRLNYLVPAKR